MKRTIIWSLLVLASWILVFLFIHLIVSFAQWFTAQAEWCRSLLIWGLLLSVPLIEIAYRCVKSWRRDDGFTGDEWLLKRGGK